MVQNKNIFFPFKSIVHTYKREIGPEQQPYCIFFMKTLGDAYH